MALSINQKQNYLYLGMIVLTMIAAVITYQATQKKWLLYHEAEINFEGKNYPEAIALYRESLAKGNTRPNALSRIGDSYAAMENFPEAIKWYRQYLEIYPEDTNVRFSLARVLGWSGHIQEAEKEYEKVLEEQHEMDQTP